MLITSFIILGVASGDVNGDGYSDVITSGGGETCIFFGGVTMDTIPDVVITEFSGCPSIGYFNKGKYADIVIGNRDSQGSLGSARVFLGGSPMDSTSDWGVVGEYAGELGASVASAGDVNGDSVEDIIIGEPCYPFHHNIGRAYVYKGDTLYNGVEDCNPPYQVPREFELYQNYPNPFNATTIINYELLIMNSPVRTTLKVYNLLGKEVKTLVDKSQKGGHYEVSWDGRDEKGREVGSGIYFCRLEVIGDRLKVVETRKMLLIR